MRWYFILTILFSVSSAQLAFIPVMYLSLPALKGPMWYTGFFGMGASLVFLCILFFVKDKIYREQLIISKLFLAVGLIIGVVSVTRMWLKDGIAKNPYHNRYENTLNR